MSTTTPDTAPLTVVLVHGAFTDASSWNGVIERLQAAGVQVTAPANPLRGLSADSAYFASFLEQIPGPVLPVGHLSKRPRRRTTRGAVEQSSGQRRAS
jgi:alpha-beta hydrolase superfamily lysophospholipase